MDFAPRNNVSVIAAAKLHATIACVGAHGSPIPRASFNLDACFRNDMENHEAMAAERTAIARTALSGGEGR